MVHNQDDWFAKTFEGMWEGEEGDDAELQAALQLSLELSSGSADAAQAAIPPGPSSDLTIGTTATEVPVADIASATTTATATAVSAPPEDASSSETLTGGETSSGLSKVCVVLC